MKKIVLALLAFFVIGLIGTAVTMNASGGFNFNTVELNEEQVFDGSQIKNIKVNLSAADVKVISTKEKEITVRLGGNVSKKYKDDYSLDIEQNDNTLEIKMRDKNKFKKWFSIGINIIDTMIEVELPERVYENLNIKTSSGDINFENLQAQEITLNASSGDVFAENSKAINQFSIHASSGDIKSDNNKAEVFAIDAQSGDLFIKDQTSKNAELLTSSGDINLKNVLGNILTEASSGDIVIHNKEVAGDIQSDASSGDVRVKFDQEPTSLSIDFSGNSGEGHINVDGVDFQEKSEDRVLGEIGDGQFKLKVDTKSGDFFLN